MGSVFFSSPLYGGENKYQVCISTAKNPSAVDSRGEKAAESGCPRSKLLLRFLRDAPPSVSHLNIRAATVPLPTGMTGYQTGRRIRGQCVKPPECGYRTGARMMGCASPSGSRTPSRPAGRGGSLDSCHVGLCVPLCLLIISEETGVGVPPPHVGDKLGQQGFFGCSRLTEDSLVSSLTWGPNSFPLRALPDSKLTPIKLEPSLCRSATVDSCPPIPFPGTCVGSDHQLAAPLIQQASVHASFMPSHPTPAPHQLPQTLSVSPFGGFSCVGFPPAPRSPAGWASTF